MKNDLISQALSTAADTREFRVGAGILPQTAEVFKANFAGCAALIVADETTWRICGAAVEAILKGAGVECAKPLLFAAEPPPTATYENLCRVGDALTAAGPDARAVAVGAGTINDLCKCASDHLKRPYLCVATAASVDGYASFGAPITKDGFKKTWPCAAPRAIVADSSILAAAPRHLSASGYADLAAKIPSGADWILADAVQSDPIRDDVWATTQKPLRGWISSPAALAAGDGAAMDSLFTGLALTGFAMQTTHTSRPASGAEHLFSHCWEMADVRRPDGEHPSHGDKVGIGALATTLLLEKFFSESFCKHQIDAAVAAYPDFARREAFIRATLPAGRIADEAVEASRAKHLDEAALRARLAIIADRFEELALRVREQLIPFDEFREMLRAAGCPVKPSEIGVGRRELLLAAYGAQMIRNRYTILDLAYEAGRLPAYASWLVAAFWE
ncbi:MAG: sn-glycerol-1-phosphate dehydrogenase [Kiritimatiellae bacterium]|nr:sn-glycerol-1-phosphate dehydrogenase [Kiritimatiellia bacterium]